MQRISKYLVSYGVSIGLLWICWCTHAFALGDKYLTLYGAVLTGDSIDKTYRLEADFDSSFTLLALALGTKMTPLVDRYLNFGVEAQLAKHFGGQQHLEINGLLVFRCLCPNLCNMFHYMAFLNMNYKNWHTPLNENKDLPQKELYDRDRLYLLRSKKLPCLLQSHVLLELL